MGRWFGRRRTDQVVEVKWRNVQADVVRARQTRERLLNGQQDLVASLADLEFVHWFGASIAGSAERYAPIAREAWRILPAIHKK